MEKKEYIAPECKNYEFEEQTNVLQAVSLIGDQNKNDDDSDDDWEATEQNAKKFGYDSSWSF